MWHAWCFWWCSYKKVIQYVFLSKLNVSLEKLKVVVPCEKPCFCETCLKWVMQDDQWKNWKAWCFSWCSYLSKSNIVCFPCPNWMFPLKNKSLCPAKSHVFEKHVKNGWCRTINEKIGSKRNPKKPHLREVMASLPKPKEFNFIWNPNYKVKNPLNRLFQILTKR